MKTIGILSPGDMGHAFGRVLGDQGFRVITCLQGRSERTRLLANKAEIKEVPSYQALVQNSNLILSILVPAQAKQAAKAVAQAIKETKSLLIYVDCNAIAPQTANEIGGIINDAGGSFVDGGIIGNPPTEERKTRLYVSGPSANNVKNMIQSAINVIVLGDQIGQASAIKMCNAALTKGFTAVSTELLVAAEALNISQALKEDFKENKPDFYNYMLRRLPVIPMKSRRYVGEMIEIAKTFEHVGLTPKIFLGAADIYRLVGSTALSDRNPEDPEPLPSLDKVIKTLSVCLSGLQKIRSDSQ